MEITKFGETYKIQETTQTYNLNGEIIKATNGQVLINVSTSALDNIQNIISLLNGTYDPTNDNLVINFNTKVSKYNEQVDIIETVLDAIKNMLNEQV